MNGKTVVFVLIPEYGDWEAGLLAACLRRGFGLWENPFDIRIAAPGTEPVTSIGGFRVVPDYTFESTPDGFAALLLIGGTNWFGDEARRVLPLVRRAIDAGSVVGGICDAALFLGANGFLNAVHHTGNSLAAMKDKGGSAYAGEARYHSGCQSVRDMNIITPTGSVLLSLPETCFWLWTRRPKRGSKRFILSANRGCGKAEGIGRKPAWPHFSGWFIPVAGRDG